MRGQPGPPPASIHAEETTAQRLQAVLSDVSERCGADAGVLLGHEADGWRLLGVSGAATRMRVGSMFSFDQNPSLSPIFADERPPMPTVEPFIEALGPIALGDAIHCPIGTSDGLAGMLCLYTAWSRPFQPERADLATKGAELVAALLAETALPPSGDDQDPTSILSLAVSLLNHDMRSPIHAILGFSELLATRDGASQDEIRYTATIREGGEQMSRQLDQVVGLMRLILGETRPAPAPTPLVRVLDDLPCTQVPKLTVLWDAALVRTALIDLLDYTETAGTGRNLTASSGEGRVYLTIGQTPQAPEPVGLGFRSAGVQRARQLIDLHGGTLQSDASGFGFTIILPV
ncbi:MAG: hypothetical protein OEY97_07980 [Nitrospirota bacterium]|nr:hypothetical protein [Nitrospirota bacterium]